VLDDDCLQELADDLCEVAGVRAVALGGSRARGSHRPDSDFDLGVYYEGDLDLGALEHLAARWADAPVRVTAPGGWGPWVNGGAWLTIDGTAVDWIFRDRHRVAEQCERARRGEFGFHAQAGHPLGFLDISYAGEIATCVRLRDADAILAELSQRVSPYPEALRVAMLTNLWQVDFLLDAAEKGAKALDVAYVTLCLTTAAMLTAHGWHALAGRWVTNEKALVPGVARLPVDAHGFSDLVAAILGSVGSSNPAELHDSIAAMRAAPRPSEKEHDGAA
jgi:hypothetical protein